MSTYYHFKYDNVLMELDNSEGGTIELQFKVGKDIFHLILNKEQLSTIKKYLNEREDIPS